MSGNTASSNRRECLTSSTQQLHKLIAVLLPRGKEGEKAVTEVQSLSAFFFFLIPSRISKSLSFFAHLLYLCWQELRVAGSQLQCLSSEGSFGSQLQRLCSGGVGLLLVLFSFVSPLYIYIYISLSHCVLHFENFQGSVTNACCGFQCSVSPATIITDQIQSRISN